MREEVPQTGGDGTDGASCEFDTHCDSDNCDNDTSDASCTCVGDGTGGNGGSGGSAGNGGGAIGCATGCPERECEELSDSTFEPGDWEDAQVTMICKE